MLEGVDELIVIYATLGAEEQRAYWQARGDDDPLASVPARMARLLAKAESGAAEYAGLAAAFRQLLEADSEGLDQLSLHLRLGYGALLALAGEYPGARQILEPVVDAGAPAQMRETTHEIAARQALAWAWLNTGETKRARALLALDWERCRRMGADGRLHRSGDIFECARNQVLLGDTEHAPELLERAEQAGWRDYSGIAHDPSWNALRGQPRFRAVIAHVKADLDAQRDWVERVDAEDGFLARLDAATSH